MLTGVLPLHFFTARFFKLARSGTSSDRRLQGTLAILCTTNDPDRAPTRVSEKNERCKTQNPAFLQFLDTEVTELHPRTVTEKAQVTGLPQQTRVLLQYRRIGHSRQIGR